MREARVELVVVQHASKAPGPGDVGLTEQGVVEAREAGHHLAAEAPWERLFTSPMRRAAETANILSEAVGLAPVVDDRLIERMNYDEGMALDDFVARWARTTCDRAFVPHHSDSSNDAARRFLEALESYAVSLGSGRVLIVSHGGVTTDAARTLAGDDTVRSLNREAIEDGLAPCSTSRFVWTSAELRLLSLGERLQVS